MCQTVILWIMHFIPFMRLRVDENSELIGIDESQMGEFAYDYVGLDSEVPLLSDTASATGGGREPQHAHVHEQGEQKRSIPSATRSGPFRFLVCPFSIRL
jgi:Amt family ammonium transporter